MNHLRNMKEMLSIPTGSSTINRNVATSGYSSFTDSQLFFGSQFWPENSQGLSQDMSLSSRNSQQSSQEGSDPKFSSNYHTKPSLFGDLKDKSKYFGILDKFEEDKKKVKEKTDSDILAKECNHFRDTLNNIQQLVAGTEKNTAVCQTVLQQFNNFASTLQNNLNSLQSDISQQFETLLNKVNSQKEMMTELKERLQKSGDTTAELGSNLQSLKNSLTCLREEQERERNMLEEALKLLSSLVSEYSTKPSPTMDSAIQTSPGLQDNKLQGTQFTADLYNFKYNQTGQVPLQDSSCIIAKRKFALRGRRRKKRPLVLPQRSKHSVTNENRQPLLTCDKQPNISTPLCEHRDANMATGQDSLNPGREIGSIAERCFITPLSCWSQESSSSLCFVGIEPILEKSKRGTPVKPDGLWQLFDMDSDLDLGF